MLPALVSQTSVSLVEIKERNGPAVEAQDEEQHPRLEISVSMDISVLVFYGYIGYIGDISVDIFL